VVLLHFRVGHGAHIPRRFDLRRRRLLRLHHDRDWAGLPP
jgi:hypothetical protein